MGSRDPLDEGLVLSLQAIHCSGLPLLSLTLLGLGVLDECLHKCAVFWQFGNCGRHVLLN